MKKLMLIMIIGIFILSSFAYSGNETINDNDKIFKNNTKIDFILKDNLINETPNIVDKKDYDLIKKDALLKQDIKLKENDININSNLINYWIKEEILYFELEMDNDYIVYLNNKIKPINYYKKDNNYIISFDSVIFSELHVGKFSDVWIDGIYTSGGILFYNMSNVGTIVPNIANQSRYNGTAQNGVIFNNDSITDYAQFDGTDDYVGTNLAGNSFNSQDFTESVWVKTTSTDNKIIISYRDVSASQLNRIQLFLNNGDVRFLVYAGGTFSFDETIDTNINDGNWHHVSVTRTQGDTNYIYVDGVEIFNGSDGGQTINFNSDTFKIGRQDYSGGSNYFDGSITGVSIFNEAKNSTWVEEIYSFGRGYQFSLPPPIINLFNITNSTNGNFIRNDENINVTINVSNSVNGTLNCSDETGNIYNEFFNSIGYNTTFIPSSVTTSGNNVTCNLTVYSVTSTSKLSNTIFINDTNILDVYINDTTGFIYNTSLVCGYNTTYLDFFNVSFVNLSFYDDDNFIYGDLLYGNVNSTILPRLYYDNSSKYYCNINVNENISKKTNNITNLQDIIFENLTITSVQNSTSNLGYNITYDLLYGEIVSKIWFVNGTNVLNDTDFLNNSFFSNNKSILYNLTITNNIYNFTYILTFKSLLKPILINETVEIDVLSYITNDTNFTVDAGLNVNYTVQVDPDSGLTNDQTWFEWFINGVKEFFGWGVNSIKRIFTADEIGNATVLVNATFNPDVNVSVVSENITWEVNVTQPIQEVNFIEVDYEVYDSLDIYCPHNYTGHIWYYDIDAKVKLKNGEIVWLNTSQLLLPIPFIQLDMTEYAVYDNVSVRCRTWNEFFNYSNFTQVDNINKRVRNQVKFFKTFNTPQFTYKKSTYISLCDMNKTDRYEILYHWVDGNGDGLYDKLKEYNEGEGVKISEFSYDSMFYTQGNKTINTGCVINKLNNDVWEFPNCKYDENTCAIQKTYQIEVKN